MSVSDAELSCISQMGLGEKITPWEDPPPPPPPPPLPPPSCPPPLSLKNALFVLFCPLFNAESRCDFQDCN